MKKQAMILLAIIDIARQKEFYYNHRKNQVLFAL